MVQSQVAILTISSYFRPVGIAKFVRFAVGKVREVDGGVECLSKASVSCCTASNASEQLEEGEDEVPTLVDGDRCGGKCVRLGGRDEGGGEDDDEQRQSADGGSTRQLLRPAALSGSRHKCEQPTQHRSVVGQSLDCTTNGPTNSIHPSLSGAR